MSILKKYLNPMIEKNIDYLVLGCTHYPFLQEPMKEILGDKVVIVDPAAAVAHQTLNVLKQSEQIMTTETVKGQSTFLSSGDIHKMKSILSMVTKSHHEVHAVLI